MSAKTTAGKAVTVTLSCTDPDGDPVTIRTAPAPKGGKLGAIAGATVKYTPNASTTGSDSFTYVASDGLKDSAAATARIAIEAVVVAAPGPRDATVEVNPKGGFWLAVWYTVPKACGKSCKTTVEVRSRTGKRLFDASLLGKLRGDGPVLGKTTKKLKAGQRVKIWIPLSSKALLKSKWSTAGGFRATDEPRPLHLQVDDRHEARGRARRARQGLDLPPAEGRLPGPGEDPGLVRCPEDRRGGPPAPCTTGVGGPPFPLAATGSTRRKHAPPPSASSTSTRPPCPVATCCTMARPSPEPGTTCASRPR